MISVHTEIPDNGAAIARGCVFYDANCSWCAGAADRMRESLQRRRIALLPLQAAGVGERLGILPRDLLREMRFLSPTGEVFGGAEALVRIARRIWWGWPLFALSRLPGVMPMLGRGYRWLADRRGCAGGACLRRRPSRLLGWLPLAALPRIAHAFKPALPAWAFAWAMGTVRRVPVNFHVQPCVLGSNPRRSLTKYRSAGGSVSPHVWLKRHPIPVVAHFQHSLVLTYALPKELLESLLPPALVLDTFKDFGFVAIAMVQAHALRPAFLPPWLGRDFFLAGYRIFARYKTRAGRVLRGLRILRSDTDSRLMAFFGNRLTHYNYRVAGVNICDSDLRLEIEIKTPHAEADLHVVADLTSRPSPLPPGSPFADLHEARLFAGPLPFTFDYEAETHSIVMIEGVRENWKPSPIHVEVLKNTFFDQAPFNRAAPVLANAFHIQHIPYRWKRGVREALPTEETSDEQS